MSARRASEVDMTKKRKSGSAGEQGFTLIEALIATVILIFGLVGIANLMTVGATSNAAGNHSTAATTQASEVLERLKSIPFNPLFPATGGSLTASVGNIPSCVENTQPAPGCVVAGNFNQMMDVAGVGRIRTRWTVVDPGNGTDTLFITVQSESLGSFVGGRTRATFTTFRTCTVPGCP